MVARLVAFARYLARSVLTIIALVAFAIVFPIVRWVVPSKGPRLLRWLLERMGGGFLKLGQVLAMRFDLLPAAYYRELMSLLDRAPRLRFEKIRAVIEADLGAPLTTLFASFDRKPLAAASIAQAHAAELADGQRVVVKVKRPDAERMFKTDLQNFARIARVAQWLGIGGKLDLVGLARQVSRLTSEELDFRREAFNCDHMRELLASDSVDHRAPHVFFSHCGKQVITMERFEGIWLSDLLRAVQANDRAKLDDYRARGADPQRISRLVFRSVMEQCFHHRMFHADPHAANMIVLEGGTLGLIDFGMIGRFDEKLWAEQIRAVQAVFEGNLGDAYESLLSLVGVSATKELEDFETEVKDLFWTWRAAARSPHATIVEKSYGFFFLRIANAVRKIGLRLPGDLMRYYRAQIVSEMSVYGLDPQLDLVGEFERFISDERERYVNELVIDGPHRLLTTAAIDVPAASRAMLDFVRYRLPDLGKSEVRSLSGLERMFDLSLTYMQRLGWISCALALGIATGVITRVFPQATWAEPTSGIGTWWWVVAGGAAVIAWYTRRMRAQLRGPE